MANGWTPERRAKQSKMIQHWKPWQSAAGPCTIEGKRCSSRNAQKANSMREVRKALIELKRVMKKEVKTIL